MATLVLLGDMIWAATAGRGGHVVYLMQWLRGLERLGHRVLFLELIQEVPTRAALQYYAEAIRDWWYPEQTALVLERTRQSLLGVNAETVVRVAKDAAALITLAVPGSRKPPILVDEIRPRILAEQDPGYSHLWAADRDPLEIFGEQDFYFTVGGNIGSNRCSVPCYGIRWLTTWNPIVIDWWSPEEKIVRDHFTTIASWWDQGYLEFEGQLLGPKAGEFRKFAELPVLTGESIEVVAEMDPSHPDFAYFSSHGWEFASPAMVGTGALYRDYVNGSGGEFSCAKGVYVGTRCGWFSDRSSCFLAAGRPVVLQGTGFADSLPTGRGLLSVATAQEAAEAIKEVRKDYGGHSAAAREIAVEHFDSDKLLSRMLAEAGIESTIPTGTRVGCLRT